MDAESFMAYEIAEYIYLEIAKDVEARFDSQITNKTDHYPKEKNKKLLGLSKD